MKFAGAFAVVIVTLVVVGVAIAAATAVAAAAAAAAAAVVVIVVVVVGRFPSPSSFFLKAKTHWSSQFDILASEDKSKSSLWINHIQGFSHLCTSTAPT